MTQIDIIQGGMGIAVSGWKLARTVSMAGQLGMVSGTSINAVFARRLQDGDPSGDLRRALDAFPSPEIAQRVKDAYFLPEGRPDGRPYKAVPVFAIRPVRALIELSVVANFAEVWLAKEGHDGVVGINYLTKLDLPLPTSAYGAILAGVDYVIMGAGIPKHVPEVLTALSERREVHMPLIMDEGSEPATMVFDPNILEIDTPITRPKFLAIIGANTLANFLARDPKTRPDGFVVETPVAGGHNAPPRGTMTLDDLGQPIYTDRDVVDLDKLDTLGLPYWVAGGQASHEALLEVKSHGAQGIQVGTAFALCEESGLDPTLRERALAKVLDGSAKVFTDPVASPSGYPFKVFPLEGTVSEQDVYEERDRICDLGYLRNTYRTPSGKISYRCASEPIDAYLKKGGSLEATKGRKCLCNALMADIGLGQVRPDGRVEQPLITAGDEVEVVRQFLAPGATSYSALDVIRVLLEGSST